MIKKKKKGASVMHSCMFSFFLGCFTTGFKNYLTAIGVGPCVRQFNYFDAFVPSIVLCPVLTQSNSRRHVKMAAGS